MCVLVSECFCLTISLCVSVNVLKGLDLSGFDMNKGYGVRSQRVFSTHSQKNSTGEGSGYFYFLEGAFGGRGMMML